MEEKQIISDENLEILFKKDNIIIRTMDSVGSPIDIYKFEKSSLSKNERIFIENMLSMSNSMVSKFRDKKNVDCKCKNCLSFFSYIDNPSYKKKRVEKKRKIKNKK